MSGPLSSAAWLRLTAEVPQLLSNSRNQIMVESLLLGMRSANFPFNDDPEGEYPRGSLQFIARRWDEEGLLTPIIQALDKENLLADWPISVDPQIMFQKSRRLRDILILALMRARSLPVPVEPSQEEIDRAALVSELLISVEGFDDSQANRLFLKHLDALMTDPEFHWATVENGDASYSILKRLERDDALYILLKRIVELGLAENWPEAKAHRNPFQRKSARDRIHALLKKAKTSVSAKMKRREIQAASKAQPTSSRKGAVKEARNLTKKAEPSEKSRGGPERADQLKPIAAVQINDESTLTDIEAMMNRPGRKRPGKSEPKASHTRRKLGLNKIRSR